MSSQEFSDVACENVADHAALIAVEAYKAQEGAHWKRRDACLDEVRQNLKDPHCNPGEFLAYLQDYACDYHEDVLSFLGEHNIIRAKMIGLPSLKKHKPDPAP